MGTVPTGQLERELRALYLRWLRGLKPGEDFSKKLDQFQRNSIDLMDRLGGQAARLGAYGDFPAPKRLDLAPVAGYVYNEMQTAAIQAGIMTGLGAADTARQMFKAGMDKSYRKLERIARTETVRAYWKNSWDSVDGLGLVMIWSAEEGPRTCPWCLERDGMVVESRSVQDHPNGRCTLVPRLPNRVDYKGTVQEDGTIQATQTWTDMKPTNDSVAFNSPSSGALYDWDSVRSG